MKNGPRFFKLLQEVSKIKPVVLFKGGLTQGGARAVSSHTGSLAGDEASWNAVFKQTNAIRVNSLDELIDTVLAFSHLSPHRTRKVCVVGGGGGISVAAADSCDRVGLALPQFSAELQAKLRALLPPVGSSVRNPVDVANPFPNPAALTGVLETVLTEGGVDAVIIDTIEMALGSPAMKAHPERRYLSNHEELVKVPVEVKSRLGKPIVMVMPVEATGAENLELEADRRSLCDYYLKHGIPVYLTLERAARALSSVARYYERYSD